VKQHRDEKNRLKAKANKLFREIEDQSQTQSLEQLLNRSLQNLEDPYLRSKYFSFLKAKDQKNGLTQALHPSEKQKRHMKQLS